MSKNHPDDNMYSILGKLAALQPTPAEVVKEKAQAIRESVEAQGSILGGVASATEAKLRKQFNETLDGGPMGSMGVVGEEGEVTKTPTGLKHRGTKGYGADYEPGQGVEFAKQKYHGDMEKVNKGLTKNLEKGMDVELDEVTPPGMEKMVHKLKKEYPGEQGKAKAYATAWSIYNKKHGKADESREVCAECSMQEGEVTVTPGKTVHRKTDYPGYPSDEAEKDNEPASIVSKKGRPRKASTVNPRRDPSNKGNIGRATKSDGEKSMASMPWGGKPPKDTWKPQKGSRVHRISEGLNFKKMAEETNMSIDEMLNQLNNDIKVYKTTGECSPVLRDFLEVHAHGKRQMADEALGGIGHDLVTPQQRVQQATPAKPGMMGAVKDVAQGASNWLRGKPESGPTYEETDPLTSELNELAKLAGLKVSDDTLEEGQMKEIMWRDAERMDRDAFVEKWCDGFGDEYAGEFWDNIMGDLDEADAPVDEPVDGELENAPNPKYASIKTITTQGDDLNRPKRQDPQTANRAANPLTNTMKMEAKLMAEYESIKKVSK